MANLVPVDHQPEFEADQAAMMPETYVNPMAKHLVGTIGGTVANAVMAPGRALASETPLTSEQMVAPAMDMAGLTTLGAGAIPAEANEMRMGIKAYHGSPYDFEKFDLSKIGTGEGAQAYGHGIYLAEHEPTAKYYRDAVTATMPPKRGPQGGLIEPEGHMYEVNINADPAHFLDWDKPLSEQSQHVKDVIAKIDSSLSMQAPNISTIKDQEIRSIVRRAAKANDGKAQGLELAIDNDSGLYHSAVNHAKRNGIDLDAQDMRASDYIYQQAEPYIDALHASQNLAGDSLGKVLGVKGADMMQSGPAVARLREAGIPGIKYFDQGSRVAGEGSRNYVVFNPDLIDILKKYGIAGLPAAGAAAGALQAQPSQADMVNAIRGQGG